MRKLWLEINARAFPGSTSNHHLGTHLAMLAATLEMNASRTSTSGRSWPTPGRSPATAPPRASRWKAARRRATPAPTRWSSGSSPSATARRSPPAWKPTNIVTNYQALPDDETFYHPSGIRMGVQEMTRFGMKEKDFERLAGFIADVIIRKKDVAGEVAAYRQQFSRMHYCLSAEETLRIGPALFESIFPDHAYFQGFAEALRSLHHGLEH